MKDLTEVLTAVLGKPVESYSYIKNFREPLETDFFSVTFKNGDSEAVNIYKFAFMSKMWAFDNGYLIESSVEEVNVYPIDENGAIMSREQEILIIDEDSEGNTDYPDDEIEAILEAILWILEQEKNDD